MSNDNGTLTYVYEYKDHLGNTRLSYTDADNDGDIATNEIVKESNYYPFGLAHQGYKDNVSSLGNSVAKKFMFGGKEFQNELNLDWYDITARNYDPALGRWMNLDPLAEDMRRHSPYNFAFDNPISFIDPDGMRVEWGKGLSPEDKELIGYLIYQLRKNSKSFDELFKTLHESENTFKVGDSFEPDAEFKPSLGAPGYAEYDEDLDLLEVTPFQEVDDFGGNIKLPLFWADKYPSLEIDKTLKAKQTIVEEFVHAVQWETLFPSSGKTTLDFYIEFSNPNTEFEAKAVTGIIHREVGWNVLTGGNKLAARTGNQLSRGFGLDKYNRGASKWFSSPKTNPGYKEYPDGTPKVLENKVLPTVLINVIKAKK